MTEKWNMDVRFTKDSDLNEDDLPKKDIKRLRQMVRTSESHGKEYGGHELEKTQKELDIIHRMNEAAKTLLEDLGLPPLTISDKAVHIIKVSKYAEAHESNTMANHLYGNIFVTRKGDDEAGFINNLAHEITHDLGYHLNKLNLTTEKNNGLISNVDIDEAVKNFLNRTTKGDHRVGRGLTEGMTEIIARGLKRAYCDIAKLGPKQKEQLDKYTVYFGHIFVLENIFDLINPNNHDEALYLFAKAYMTGDQNIYKMISDKFRALGIKDGLKILMQMGATADNAFVTAKKLKLKQAEKNILDYYDKK